MYGPEYGVSFATEPLERGDCDASQYGQAEDGNNNLRLPDACPEETQPEEYAAIECCMNGDKEDDEAPRNEV